MSRKEKTQDEIRTFNDKDFEMFSGITEMLVNTDIPQNAFAAAEEAHGFIDKHVYGYNKQTSEDELLEEILKDAS